MRNLLRNSERTDVLSTRLLAEELPIRLAHRAKELDELPHNLSDMPSINKVKNWYCQSFEVRPSLPTILSHSCSSRECYASERGEMCLLLPPCLYSLLCFYAVLKTNLISTVLLRNLSTSRNYIYIQKSRRFCTTTTGTGSQ